jgi:hypothetical protein
MPRLFWFCIRPYPALPYTGLWCPNNRAKHLTALYLIRAGRIYRAESLPPDLPNYCEGENFGRDWGIPAVYRQVSGVGWVGLTQGCTVKGLMKDLYPNHVNFCFTYPAGSDRLHIYADGGVSYPLRWHRISQTELEMDLAWN